MSVPDPLFYILDHEHRPVCVGEDVRAWGEFFRDIEKRRVATTEITADCFVSTVFLGIDRRYGGKGPPLLFETMIFGGPLDQHTWRYSSWDDAETGHAAAVRKAREAITSEA